jgi:hypothetical protein
MVKNDGKIEKNNLIYDKKLFFVGMMKKLWECRYVNVSTQQRYRSNEVMNIDVTSLPAQKLMKN